MARRYVSSTVNTHKEDIIRDLLKARPAGYNSGLHIAYDIKNVCVGYDDSNRPQFRDLAVPVERACRYFNYTIEQLYNLELHSYDDCVKYFALQCDAQVTITRRSRLLWTRIRDAVDEYRRNGQRGIYKMEYSYREMGYVFAASTEEARQLAYTTLAYAFNINSYAAIKAVYIGPCSVDELARYNKALITTRHNKLHTMQNDIDRLMQSMQECQLQIDALNILQSQQIAIANIAAIDKCAE